jgi:hypothetical protein
VQQLIRLRHVFDIKDGELRSIVGPDVSGTSRRMGSRLSVQINFAYPTLNPEVSVQVPD